MSHNLFASEKGDNECLPDIRIPTPPPPTPEPVDEADPAEFGLDTPMPTEKEVEEVSNEMFKPKLLDDVDAKDWRAKNNRKAPGQRGKDKTPRKKPELTEKRKAALAKARAASSAKAKAVREAKAQANKKIPDKQEIKMEVKEKEEPTETKGKYVVIDETTIDTPMPIEKPTPPPPKLKRQQSVREVAPPPPTARERTYSIAEFNQFKELFGGRSSVQSPVAQPIPHRASQPIPVPQPKQQVRAGQRKPARTPNLNPQTAPKPKNPWDDMFI